MANTKRDASQRPCPSCVETPAAWRTQEVGLIALADLLLELARADLVVAEQQAVPSHDDAA